MHHVFAEISIEESLRELMPRTATARRNCARTRLLRAVYSPGGNPRARRRLRPGEMGPPGVAWYPGGGEVSCMIGGYQAGQISMDDLASGFRNRTWAAITRDWAAKLGPARGAADDFEPVIAGRFDDVVHACDRSASTSIGYAILAQPPPAPADEPAPASHGGTRRAPGCGRRLKTAVLAAQADPGFIGRAGAGRMPGVAPRGLAAGRATLSICKMTAVREGSSQDGR
jgi:hypothetical protein